MIITPVILIAVVSVLNPIALRTAKTPLSFGHSECNRFKEAI